MIRRWFRALAWTFVSDHPLRTPCPARRRPQTFLRLETVEDRTVASTGHSDFLESLPVVVEVQVAVNSSPAKGTTTDERAQAADGGANSLGRHDSNAGQNLWGRHARERPLLAFGDAPVLLSSDVNVSTSAAPIVPDPARRQADMGGRLAGETDQQGDVVTQANRPQSTTPLDATTDPTAATPDGTTLAGTDPGRAPPDRSAVVPNGPGSPRASAEHELNSSRIIGQDAGSPPQAGPYRETDNPVSQLRGDNSDPIGVRPNAAGRAAGASEVVAARTQGPRLPADLPDGALLQRFVANREQEAFTALVQRHARLVFGVCQQVLGDFHAAQDASQATFVVLARKAGMLDRNNSLGGWLYRVAYHLALRSRAVRDRQRLGELEAAESWAASDVGDNSGLDREELRQVVREELDLLPEKYRAPLAMCYVDGRSHAEAARAIGLPRGSMAKRMGEGLERLRERLVHRGFML